MRKIMMIFLALVLCAGSAAAESSLAGFLGDFFALEEAAEENSVSSVSAFPVSAKRAAFAENQDARPVCFYIDGKEEPAVCFIVPDEKAQIRLELAASDHPAAMVWKDLWGPALNLTDLLDPERKICVCEPDAEGTRDGVFYPFNCGFLFDRELGLQDPDCLICFVVTDEKNIGDVEEILRAAGAKEIRRETALPAPEENSLQEYVLHAEDEEGNPIREVFVNFCTDTSCVPRESDENGLITFSGAPDLYHVQLIDVPDGYRFDDAFELYTDRAYGEWVLVIPGE